MKRRSTRIRGAWWASAVALVSSAPAATSGGEGGGPSPFASAVLDYTPGAGQFVGDPAFNDPTRALGAPIGGGTGSADLSSLVTLGGIGGSITLGFDERVMDDPLNPFGIDAIIFGNAFWFQNTPTSRFGEAGIIEISRDDNGNGLADDDWFLIPGSDLAPPCTPCMLPIAVYGQAILFHPGGPGATLEDSHGYADLSPTLKLGDTDADDLVDDPSATPSEFYTVPDDPLAVGLTPGSAGGDGFDIAWAVDPVTGQPATLDGFDFIRISTGLDASTVFGEVSPEIDAVADVRARCGADVNADGEATPADFTAWLAFFIDPNLPGSQLADLTGDGMITPADFTAWLLAFDAGCGS